MKNFTLKEAILCTFCVVAMLLTVPLAIGNAQGNAKITACANNLRQIGAAELSYAADNKSELAMGEKNFIREGGTVRAATYSMGTPPMMLISKKYLKSDNPADNTVALRERFFHCPEDDVHFVKTPITGWRQPAPTISYLYCWFSTQNGLKRYSYPSKLKPDQDDSFGLRSNVDRDDPDRYIFADLIKATSMTWSGAPKEKKRANHYDQFNVLFIGGHVATKSVSPAQEKWVSDGTNRFVHLADDVK